MYKDLSIKNMLITIVTLGLMSCSSQKKLETTSIPFELGNSTFQKTMGGREETGTDAELRINVSENLKDLAFEKIYFRGQALDCELRTKDDASSIVAIYKITETSEMSSDTDGKKMQEMFKLQTNEAVLAYKIDNDKLKYVKIENIKEKAPILFKEMPKN